MWRKEETNSQSPSEVTAQSGNSPKVSSSSPMSMQTVGSKVPACVSQGIKIKGEVMGTEELFVDGVIEGKITLSNSGVTVGPNGTVKADISAREIVLRGIAEGKFTAEQRIQIWHTARVKGELKSERISIEDGAELHGKVEAGKEISKPTVSDTMTQSKKIETTKAPEGAATDAATAGAD
jgi:cytoskeletal protein CcmA (bactofilin family)